MSTQPFTAFLYASQSGNAESIAKLLHHTALTSHSFPADSTPCMTLNDAEKQNLLTNPLCTTVVIVCSTHGEGDYPDNGQRMKRWLKKAKEKGEVKLSHLRYAVLAVGDTNYAIFCGSGRDIDAKLSDLGARRFYSRGEADDGTALEIVVDPWIAGLWPALQSQGQKKATDVRENFVIEPMKSTDRVAVLYSTKDPAFRTLAVHTYESLCEQDVEADLVPTSAITRCPTDAAKLIIYAPCDSNLKSTLQELFKYLEEAREASPVAFPVSLRYAMYVKAPPATATQMEIQALTTVAKEVEQYLSTYRSKFDLTALVPADSANPLPSPVLSYQDCKRWIVSVVRVIVGSGGSNNLSGSGSNVDPIGAVAENIASELFKASWKDAGPDAPDAGAFPGVGGKTVEHPLQGSYSYAASARPTVVQAQQAQPGAGNRATDLAILKPVVFLYCGATDIPKLLAEELSKSAIEQRIDAVAADVSSYRAVGFPRSATFVFIVGADAKNLSKQFFARVEAFDDRSKSRFEQLRFAILGLSNAITGGGHRRTSSGTHPSDLNSIDGLSFHESAIALERLLLERGGVKFFATGLGRVVGSREVDKVTTFWCSQIWSRLAVDSTTASSTSPVSGSPSSRTASVAFPSQRKASTRSQYIDEYTVEAATKATSAIQSSSAITFFPWEGSRIIETEVADCPIRLVYSGEAAKLVGEAFQEAALGFGFAVELEPLSECYPSTLTHCKYLIAIVQAGRNGGFVTGKKVLKELKSPLHAPDMLGDLHCTVIGIGAGPATTTDSQQNLHPSLELLSLLTRLGASTVFGPATISSLGQVEDFAIPWLGGVLGAVTATSLRTRKALEPIHPKSHLDSLSKDKKTVVLFYAGVAQWAADVSRFLTQQLKRMGFDARLASLADFQKMPFMGASAVVFVVDGPPHASAGGSAQALVLGASASQGDQDRSDLEQAALRSNPTQARRFVKYLTSNKDSAALLNGVPFSVLDISTAPTALPLQKGTSPTSDGSPEFPAVALATAANEQSAESSQTSLKGSREMPSGGTHGTALGLYLFSMMRKLGGKPLLPAPFHGQVGSLKPIVESYRVALVMGLESQLRMAGLLPPDHDAFEEDSAGTRSASPAVGLPAEPAEPILLMYGSQQGNAEAIAHDIAEKAESRGYTVEVFPLRDFEDAGWRKRKVLIIVCSTTGEGEFPDNAQPFYKFLKQKTHPTDLLKGLKFTVLALGDTNYSRFCQAGRTLDRRLEELGATRFYARGDADDGLGLELVVEPWLEQLWPALDSVAAPASSQPAVATDRGSLANTGTDYEASITLEQVPDKDIQGSKVFPLVVKSFEVLTSPTVPAVVHMTFQVDGVQWNPGDALALLPRNDEADVDAFLEWFGVDGEDPFVPPDAPASKSVYRNSPIYDRITFPIKNRQVLSSVVSLRVQNKQFFSVLQQATTHSGDLALITSWNKPLSEEWKHALTNRLAIVDVLNLFSECRPTFRALVEYLAPMAPRYYSICSAYSKTPNQLGICFKVVPRGICTNWLMKLGQLKQSKGLEIEVRGSLRQTAEFRMPIDPKIPLIMIGPGTGVAPFIAFLQHRAAQLELGSTQLGEAHLFFGCRKRDTDFLFRSQLEAFDPKVLKELHVAFSQETGEGLWYGGTYVQDKLQDSSAHLCNLIINWSAYLFVCGDADSMARDVHQCLEDMLETYMEWKAQQATDYLKTMMHDGRYQRDIWSS